jgi:hypothetical protein
MDTPRSEKVPYNFYNNYNAVSALLHAEDKEVQTSAAHVL